MDMFDWTGIGQQYAVVGSSRVLRNLLCEMLVTLCALLKDLFKSDGLVVI
jgi:hypothetical protein